LERTSGATPIVNAVAESFFATLKVELVHDATWPTRAAARTELFEYLEVFYNGQRRHSALGYLNPRAFERRCEQEAVAIPPNRAASTAPRPLLAPECVGRGTISGRYRGNT